ncbi:ROK family transcriptional regulator [Deinococcus apachensis]|uniref:ROK family transcriptional regulator n=1 Tax=Deinococcus apachensis TaxID=309886 RepID=UPI00035D96BE|nr:ROK family transcriptional regulator [Deinococcus apachensis]
MNTSLHALRGSNATLVKAQNLSSVLIAIHHLQPVSRTDLAAKLNLTAATLTNLVGELTSLGFVEETQSPHRQIGRRPRLLTLNPATAHFVGVEISRTRVQALYVDLGGTIHGRVTCPLPAQQPGRFVLQTTIDAVRAVTEGRPPIVGIGVGVPGPIDLERGMVLTPTNFGGWAHVPLTGLLQGEFGVPVFIDDDARTAALGEHALGAGQHVPNMLYVSLGKGIGSGLILNGSLYRGTHGLAGEIGHTVLDVRGPRCDCGNHGCLETLASIPAVLQRARDVGLSVDGIEQLLKAATGGNAAAATVLEDTRTYLSAALVSAVNFCDPDLIVVGGALVQAWPGLVPRLGASVRGHSFQQVSSDVQIVASATGEDAAALGAATLVQQHVLLRPDVVRGVTRS